MQQNSPNLWDTIDRIQQTLGISDKRLADMLLLTFPEYKKVRTMRRELYFSNLANFADVLNLSFDRIAKNEIDYTVLAKRFAGNKLYLPEKYLDAAFSRRRTSIFMLNYFESIFGWQKRLELLNYFEVSESVFADPDELISISFPSDLCAYLHRYRFDDKNMVKMGLQTARVCIPDIVKTKLQHTRSVAEIYELMCNELIAKFYDQNCDYRIFSLSKNECIVDVIPKKEVTDQLGDKPVGNSAVSTLRRGIASSYPAYIGLPVADVKHVASIFHGDLFDRYIINYEKAVIAFNKKSHLSLVQNSH